VTAHSLRLFVALAGLFSNAVGRAEAAAAVQDSVSPGPERPAVALFTPLAADLRLARPDRGAARPEVIRSRYVLLNLGLVDAAALRAARKAAARGEAVPRFQLDLFDGVSLLATMETFADSADGSTVSWAGRIEGRPFSSAAVAVTGDVASGNFKTGDGGSYQLRFVSPGVFAIREIDESRFPPEGQPIPVARPPADATPRSDTPLALADDGSTIDVLVVYTPAAQTAVGGQAQIENLIELAITETNQGYANSGVVQRVRLARKEQISYVERSTGTAAFSNALDDLAGTADAYLTGVHALRNTYAADFVSLWIQEPGLCGLAYLMAVESPAFEDGAFSVVAQACAAANYSFAHEMGHNQGSHHDRANAGTCGGVTCPGVKDYSYGYGKSAPGAFRSVMAYAGACNNCARLNYWSNPTVNFSGSPMGIASPAINSADNRQSLNDTRVTVSNFRASNVVTVPGAPVMGKAIAGNLHAMVEFGPPSSNGGAAVTGYKATCGAQSTTGSGSPITVTGLLNGVAVTCAVQAQNSAGLGASSTASNSVTPAALSTLTAPASTGVTAQTATIGGTLTSDGGTALTERGLVYALTSANASPLISGTGVSKVVVTGTAMGAFTSALSNLAPGTAYSFRAFATNGAGTAYSAAASFTTLSGTTIPRLVNLSTRGLVATGDNIMIGGFIVGGSGPKKVIIRGRGPSMASLGVPGTLADPAIRLFNGSTPIEFNDNWQTAANAAEVTASGQGPTFPAEAALLTTVSPNVPYTVHVTGVGDTTGIGIVEVFELDKPETPLLNISTRGPVLTGDNILIGGFIIQGDAAQQVLIVAKGPSLGQSPFNLGGALPDPTLDLYSGSTVIESNDNWGEAHNTAAIGSSGNAPSHALESAILRSLAPGAYTAIVKGKGSFQGIGLVEVYKK